VKPPRHLASALLAGVYLVAVLALAASLDEPDRDHDAVRPSPARVNSAGDLRRWLVRYLEVQRGIDRTSEGVRPDRKQELEDQADTLERELDRRFGSELADTVLASTPPRLGQVLHSSTAHGVREGALAARRP